MEMASVQNGASLLHAYAYAGVLLIAFIDATGIPFPGRLLLIVAGTFAAAGRLDIVPLVGAGAAGALLGDHLWYFAGRWKGEALVELVCHWIPGRRQCRSRAHDALTRYGAMAFVIGRFATGIRLLASAAAGSGIAYPRFLLFDTAGALAWAALFVSLGYVIGTHAPWLADKVGLWTALGVGALALVAGAVVFAMWRRRAGQPARR